MKQLGSDLSSAQKEMKTKHKAYENAVGILSRRLQEALAAKEAAEAELSQLRARVAGGGSDHTLHVGNLLTPLVAENRCRGLQGHDVYRHLPSETLLGGFRKEVCGQRFFRIPRGSNVTGGSDAAFDPCERVRGARPAGPGPPHV